MSPITRLLCFTWLTSRGVQFVFLAIPVGARLADE